MAEKLVWHDRLKASFWRRFAPLFPYAQLTLIRIGILRHDIRQHFLIGHLAPGKTIHGLMEHLRRHGFRKHRIAWIDRDEILGMRKLVNFHWQYHLRVFIDREIRVHYEYTPESKPIDHLREVGMEQRREEFLAFLGEWVVDLEQKNTPQGP